MMTYSAVMGIAMSDKIEPVLSQIAPKVPSHRTIPGRRLDIFFGDSDYEFGTRHLTFT